MKNSQSIANFFVENSQNIAKFSVKNPLLRKLAKFLNFMAKRSKFSQILAKQGVHGQTKFFIANDFQI